MASSTQSFVDWFVNNGGEFSSELVKVVDDVDGMGRGLVAVKDIEVGIGAFESEMLAYRI